MSCARSFWPESSSSSSARFVAQSPSGSAGSDSAGSDSMSSDATRSAQQTSGTGDDTGGTGETCDVCGMAEGTWRKCKLVCRNCGTILKSCADL